MFPVPKKVVTERGNDGQKPGNNMVSNGAYKKWTNGIVNEKMSIQLRNAKLWNDAKTIIK